MKETFKSEKGHLVLTATFDQEEIRKASDKAIRKLSEKVTVPGFRKGKAPLQDAVRYLRNNDVTNATIDALLDRVNNESMKNEEFNAYFKANRIFTGISPKADLTKFSNQEAEFVITYILQPEMTKVGTYKDIKTNIVEEEVKDEDIDNFIKSLALENAELVSVDREAKEGDTVNIDFVGLMEGKPFDGGSAKAFDLELGSKHFVPGFEEQCVGHKVGDKFDVSLTLPDNYPEPLTSKPAVFKVTINAVKEKQVPEVNDEFATTLSGKYVASNLEELKGKVRDELKKNNHRKYVDSLINTFLNTCRDSSEYVIADEFLDYIINSKKEQDRRNIEKQGVTLEEYLKLIGKEEKDYEEELRRASLNEIHSALVYSGISREEKIAAPTQEEIEKRIGSKLNDFASNYVKYLKQMHYSEEDANRQVNNYIQQIISSILYEKVQTRVLELNGFVDESAKEEKEPVEETKETEQTKDEGENN